MSEHHLLLFLVQVLLLLGLARGFGGLLRRAGHPPLVGEILIGVLLGPTLLGRALPELQQAIFPPDAIQQSMLDTVSWLGVLFLLLETGLEVDVSAAWRQRGPALRVGIIGVIVPLALGFALSLALPDRYLVDPESLRRALAAEEGGGPRVLGFYHSHPDAPPLPSETDRELAWPWYHYVIIRVAAGEPEETRAWELDADTGRFEERSIDYT